MKKILVTGANKGIGLGIVKKLLRDFPDTYLLLGSRDVARGEAAVREILSEMGQSTGSRLEMVHIDVCSEDSIAAACKDVSTRHGELYGLINNAGGWLSSAKDTIDLNTYAVINVTEAFLPLLLKKQGGRVVQISSAAGPSYVAKCSSDIQTMFVNKEVTFAEVEERVIRPFLKIKENTGLSDDQKTDALEKVGLGSAEYGCAKAALNSYTTETSRKFPGLLINACTPGWISTDLTKGYAEKSGKSPAEMGMKSTDDGAKAAVYLMMADLEAEIPGYESGRFYGSDAVRSPLHKYRSPGAPAYEGEFP